MKATLKTLRVRGPSSMSIEPTFLEELGWHVLLDRALPAAALLDLRLLWYRVRRLPTTGPCSVKPGQPWKLTDSSILWTQNPFKLREPCPTLLTWEFIFSFYLFQFSIIVKATIPNYELRKRAVTCCWLTGKKKKGFPSLLCLLSLMSASLTCTALVEQWVVGHWKAFILTLSVLTIPS